METQTIDLPTSAAGTRGIPFEPANHWLMEAGREYAVIDGLERMQPFFLNLVSASNHWFFCASNGALSAGRESPEHALFPYYTVDKLIDNWNSTGPWTAIVADGLPWEPMKPAALPEPAIRRRLRKSVTGDELVFEEENEALRLRFSYRWQLSHRFGFVRRARLENLGKGPCHLRLVDGLDNLIPAGIDRRMQLEFSCLADAYKISELESGGRLLVHRLSAGITDLPVPLESLRATTVWTAGLDEATRHLSRKDAESWLADHAPVPLDSARAGRGALFLAHETTLEAGASIDWLMVADLDQSQADVARLAARLADPAGVERELAEDVAAGRERLRGLVAAADGIQTSADRDVTLHHYHNTLANILRGGVPAEGYTVRRSRFAAHLDRHNRPLRKHHESWLAGLPESLPRDRLLAEADALGDPDMLRLAREYLPLVLGRRHGDPSRPWNRFEIRLCEESGDLAEHFEGNWRDIFQNWEALALSYPGFLGGLIAKFVNASTIDGFNPYRITSDGVDWEVPDENDPWASIGYWGDHQIIYLLKLLELQARIRPEALAADLDRPRHVFADVPYRLKSWQETLADPRHTVEFDPARHQALMDRKQRVGGDGLLLLDAAGEPERVTLAEKLLLPAAVKLANLVPGGGIWMNTQRPEWNDANNALAGFGTSVVTAAYLYRHLGFLHQTIAAHPAPTLRVSSSLATLVGTLSEAFDDPRWCRDEPLADADRFAMVSAGGQAAERHRTAVYQHGPGPVTPISREWLTRFLQQARDAVQGTLRQNRRPDGLYHAYRVLAIDRDAGTMGLAELPEMLEGQVAILSSGMLEPAEALDLLEALPGSDLFSERHHSYLLYPDRRLPRFLDSNRITSAETMAIGSLAHMTTAGDERILVADPTGGFRFHPSLTNGAALGATITELAADPQLTTTIERDRPAIEALYEKVFHHQAFTGRSGRMFGYEGLGCIYWHMVSKLMLAAQELTLEAAEAGAAEATIQRLATAYYAIQGGLGFRKSPQDYGAFPAEPYSHSPAEGGARQPGLTGQVKEGILCRFGELGVHFDAGCLSFRPRLLRAAEFGDKPQPCDPVRFTLAGTPVAYHPHPDLKQAEACVVFEDGSSRTLPDAVLDRELTDHLVRQTGHIGRIKVAIPATWLLS